jgi:alanyl-tRNA synthetase
LKQDISNLKGKVISGSTAFQLYDTYGFPVDLTADIAREHSLTVDMDGFNQAMDEQRERARSASQFDVDYNDNINVEGTTDFTGYGHLQDQAQIIGLLKDGESVEQLRQGDQGIIVLDKTPFYAESGGQVGDKGVISTGGFTFDVKDTRKQGGGIFVHIGEVSKGSIKKGDQVSACVDMENRQATVLNHSATHLMHAALQTVLGEHVAQKGSLVDAERLRFDFSHFEPMTQEQILAVEEMVNEQIRVNNEVQTNVMDYESAVASGAMALFGEKYGDTVRVLKIGDFSTELCGGTHAKRAGDIGLFKLTSETGVAAGVRRVEGVTGSKALEWIIQQEKSLRQIMGMVKGNQGNVQEKIQQVIEKNRQLEKELEQLKGKLASSAGTELVDQAVEVNGIKVLAARLDGADPKSLRDTVDQLKNKLGAAAIVLATVSGEKVSLVAGVTKDQTKNVKAGELVNMVALQVGGKGGGRPDMAQAGGNDPSALNDALKSVPEWVQKQFA